MYNIINIYNRYNKYIYNRYNINKTARYTFLSDFLLGSFFQTRKEQVPFD